MFTFSILLVSTALLHSDLKPVWCPDLMGLWLVLLSPPLLLPLPCFGLAVWHLAHSAHLLSPSVHMAFGSLGFYFILAFIVY